MMDASTKQSLRTLFDRSWSRILWTGLILHGILIGVSAFFIQPSSDVFILRYSAFFGVDILGAWWQVYLIPGVCLVLFGSDCLLARILAHRQVLLPAIILLYGALLIVFSGVVATAAIVMINS